MLISYYFGTENCRLRLSTTCGRVGPVMWPEYGMLVDWIWIVLGLDLGLFYAQVVACLCGL